MKIAIIGYGKMGKTIHGLIANDEVEIFNSEQDFKDKHLEDCDVAIEFTNPNVAVDNIVRCFNANVPIVVGTTGWYDNFEKVKNLCEEKRASLVYATNFSIGVNIFFEINKKAAQLFNQKDYEVSIKEIHHTTKLDAPSGTAITLANDLIDRLDAKSNWRLFDDSEPTNSNSIEIEAVRKEEVKGTHIIKFRNAIDEIEIKHKAFSREGFAKGSLLAANWIQDKKGIFPFKKVLGF